MAPYTLVINAFRCRTTRPRFGFWLRQDLPSCSNSIEWVSILLGAQRCGVPRKAYHLIVRTYVMYYKDKKIWRLAFLMDMIFWFHVLRTTIFNVLPFCSYALLSVRVHLLKTIPEALEHDGVHFGLRRFLIHKCT